MAEFQYACSLAQLQERQIVVFEGEDRVVLVAYCDGHVYCLDDVCTHDGGTLSDGRLVGCEIECPRHQARFDLRTGAARRMPATENTRAYEVKVDGDQVFVKLSNDAG